MLLDQGLRIDRSKGSGSAGKSATVEAHTKTELIRHHSASLDANDEFVHKDTWINVEDEPNHQELCNREQRFFLKSIQDDTDLTNHIQDAINSLRIAFACDESIRTGKMISI
jgi:hypothetical protein